MITVWSCGLGTNSAAVAVGLVERGLRYDLALFADTGGERDSTYAYLPILQSYLTKHGLPPIETVKKDAPTLEQDCLTRKALPAIAYGYKSCSDHYKIRPQHKYVSEWQPAIEAWERGEPVTKIIGFDVEESHRTLDYDSKKYRLWYPLVEWGWDREECERHIAAAGLPLPGKSSCFFCPNMRPSEILALANLEPDKIERALAMERNADLMTIAGLGRRWAWADVIEADKNQLKLFSDPPEKACGCIG